MLTTRSRTRHAATDLSRRHALPALALALLLVIVGSACAAEPPNGSKTATESASSPILAEFDAGGAGWAMAATADHLWIQVDPPVDSIVRIDKESGEAESAVPGGWKVESGPEGLWVTCCDWLAKIDPASGAELMRIPHGGALALADGAAWLYTESGALLAVDAETGELGHAAAIDPAMCMEIKDLLVAFGSAWVACKEGVVVRIDLAAGTSSVLPTARGTHTFAATEDAVWVTNYQAGTVTRIDPANDAATEIAEVGSGVGITAGGGFVWVADPDGIAQIDPSTAEVVGHIDLHAGWYYELVWDDGTIWASTTTDQVLKVDAP